MSDGNYNRNLLPYKDYQSGFRAGKAQTRTRALEAFRRLMDRLPLTEEQKREAIDEFRQGLE